MASLAVNWHGRARAIPNGITATGWHSARQLRAARALVPDALQMITPLGAISLA
jgi:hypothetical protein